jgi:hypothetical protein
MLLLAVVEGVDGAGAASGTGFLKSIRTARMPTPTETAESAMLKIGHQFR